MRVEHRELVALVLEEPRVGIDLELEAVRRLERVAPSHVALRAAVAKHDQTARLVRRLVARVLRELRANLGRDHHQTLSSIARSTSSASQNGAERYFQPPSARTQTTTPSSSSRGEAARDVRDRSRGDAGEQALVLEQVAHARDRLRVRDEHLPVELRHVEDRRHVAVLERAEAHHRIARQRLRRGDDDVRPALAQPRARAHQRAARAEPRDEHVDPVERRDDLGAGAFVVRARVRFVRVLERHEEGRVALDDLLREPDGAVRPLLAGRVDDLRAVELEQALALLRRVLGHHARESVAAQLADQRERDARVAARRLDDARAAARARAESQHRLRDPVLDRAGRVLPLELRVDADGRLRREAAAARRAACCRRDREGRRLAASHPPAMAGRRITVDASPTGVSSPSRVRTSSPST